MTRPFFHNETFERQDYTNNPPIQGEYENCQFHSCDFTGCDISEFRFFDCDFDGCNLSLIQCRNTALRNVRFLNCKMLGWRFDLCNTFGLSMRFEKCQLNHSSFQQLQIKNTVFAHSLLREVDFASCDLSGAKFDECDLSDATFDHTNLIKADFSTAIYYDIDPELNSIKHAKFSMHGLEGLLKKYQIEIVNG
ncbi:MAG: pentapeptide repeat-containing protein [Flavobacteriales bacterium]|nr:pentapeptide repeat-containing protein [Flavobacteriales bacterium]